MEILAAAGFAERDAGRALAFIAEFVFSSARDAVLTERFGLHPQAAELRRLLDEAPPDALPRIRALSADQFAAGDAQFEFDLDVCIAGLESRRQ